MFALVRESRCLQAFAGLAGVLLLSLPLQADEPKVVIQGNGTDLDATPLVVPTELDLPAGDFLLVPLDGGPPARANVLETDGKKQLAIFLPSLGAEQSREFRLRSQKFSEPAPNSIQVQSEDDQVVVTTGGEPFTTLQQGDFKPYLYPVIGPTGAPFTRAFPMEEVEGEAQDHPHQRSFWFTHGEVNDSDFWAADPKNRPNPKFGTIRQTELTDVSSGLAIGQFRTRDDWLDSDGKKLLEDERLFRFSAAAGVRYIDVEITLKATEGPVTFGETKEGTFGIRVASTLDVRRKEGGQILNAEGIADGEAWGKQSAWVDYTGPINDKIVGVAILNHPESFRYPTAWHVRDYGLFAANPFGNKDFGLEGSGEHILEKGQSIRLGYRVILHEGRTADARIVAAFRAYAEPPTVEIQVD